MNFLHSTHSLAQSAAHSHTHTHTHTHAFSPKRTLALFIIPLYIPLLQAFSTTSHAPAFCSSIHASSVKVSSTILFGEDTESREIDMVKKGRA